LKKFARVAAFAAVAVAFLGCQAPLLPEHGTPTAQLYVSRCGQCHAPYNPQVLTAAMWSKQVEMMELKMRQAGLRPLTGEQREQILDYLKRNSTRQ